MELNDDDKDFAERARQALRQSERAMDAATAARLQVVRAHAVALAQKPRWALQWAMPVGAVAAGLLVFALLPTPVVEPAGVETLEILADDLGQEFYQDLEFYEWLDAKGERA